MTATQAPQVVVAKKAALKTSTKLPAKAIEANTKSAIENGLRPDTGQQKHDSLVVHGARAPPVRLLSKPEVLRLTGVTFPTIWKWMRQGVFPRARIVGEGPSSKSVWRSDEVEQWLAQLKIRPLKGDVQ
jgi:predicted DNA-binding transcriptional regulator AlpA